MPNHGRTGRCLTCKRRHVKCDEARPACSPCRRLGLACAGYAKVYAFRDENVKFVAARRPGSLEKHRALNDDPVAAGEPGRSLLIPADVAVPFFLTHHAAMGRRLAAARGFYETLTPVYTSQPDDSPLSLAVSAVAARVFSLWRHEPTVRGDSHLTPYIHALQSLRSALKRPGEQCTPATALAVLTLHLYESIDAVYDAREAAPAHHCGALSLLPPAAWDNLDGFLSTYLTGFVLHIEISSALRQKRPLHPNVHSFMRSPSTSVLVPGNFSSTLDSVAAAIADLQADYVRGMSQRHETAFPVERQGSIWITEARRIDGRLQMWARGVPDHWRPLRLTSGRDFDTSITSYRSECDVYPSCQIATLWNAWRFHRLLLLKIIIGSKCLLKESSSGLASEGSMVSTTVDSVMSADMLQGLVDSICCSVPFYLGNRSGSCGLRDLVDPDIMFPSYHSLTPSDERSSPSYRDSDGAMLSVDEYRRHILAYGAWHVLGPLSNLITLGQDENGGQLIMSLLRPGQCAWICEQFLRVRLLLRLPASRACDGDSSGSAWSSSLDHKFVQGSIENMAEQVRKGASFMSGP